MPLVLALLGALLLLAPGPASAQTSPWSSPQQPWSSQQQSPWSSQSNLTPSQRCEQSYQSCIRGCFTGDTQTCMNNCASTRAYCIQNPTAATQPRR